jgi:hypothetical protein
MMTIISVQMIVGMALIRMQMGTLPEKDRDVR